MAEVQGALLQQWVLLGTWTQVCERLLRVAAELNRRREAGQITVVQWNRAYELLSRALHRIQELVPPTTSAPAVLVATVPGDPVQIVPSGLELCLAEAGWRTRWGGPASPSDLETELAREAAPAVIVCGSAYASPAELARLGAQLLALSRRRRLPLAFMGLGRWPEALVAAGRCLSFEAVGAWLEGGRRAEGVAMVGERAGGSAARPGPRWSPELAIGHSEIDAQHAALYRHVERFLEAVHRGVDRAQMSSVMAYIGEYITSHFRVEEEAMRQAGYPEVERHVSEHEWFTRSSARLAREFDLGADHLPVARELGVFLVSWLELHTAMSDQRFGDFLRASPA
jgi:hemerythrin